MSEKWTSVSMPYLLPRAPHQADAWTEETGSRGAQRLVEVTTKAPPAEIAAALGQEPDIPVIARRRVMTFDGVPVELTDSYYPQSVAAGTPLAQRSKIRGGAPTALANLGYRIARVIEEVAQRPATPEESEALEITNGSAVLTLLRVSLSRSEHPVEASLMVMKGPRRLRYEMEVN